MRCFCDCTVELGFMLQCEKCETWQHAKCVNLNPITVGERYICPICSQKHIKCSCGDNFDYKNNLIKCTKCHYYVHKQCEGLDIGPCNPSKFICSQCGGKLLSLNDVFIPQRLSLPNPTASFYNNFFLEILNNLENSPFFSIIQEELIDQDISLFHFCEIIYNKFRYFFYLTHPYCSNQTPKKRKSEVCSSFFRSLFYFCSNIFHISNENLISLFDILARLDLYLPFHQNKIHNLNCFNPIQESDLASIEISKIKNIPDFNSNFLIEDLLITKEGVFSKTQLLPEQLICVASGFIGLAQEFNYDNGIKPIYFSINNTKLVVDISIFENQLISSFRRSLSPNCVIKIIQKDNYKLLGIFSGISDANGIDRRIRREKFSILPQTELFLPIDFCPAYFNDFSQYLSWHFENIEINNESNSPITSNLPSPRSYNKPLRNIKEEKEILPKIEKNKKIKFKEEIKPKKNKKILKNNLDVNDKLLFNLFKSDNFNFIPFNISSIEENESNNSFNKLNDIINFNEEIDFSFLNHFESNFEGN